MAGDDFLSGDPIADRRGDYAGMLAEGGDFAAAAELMQQALELAPDWAAGWFRLAGMLEKAGDVDAAVSALDRVLALDPGDIFGAGLKQAVLSGGTQPDLPPSRYVERLFDDYAGRFETALVERLDYSVPQKLGALLDEAAGSRRFRLAVDLGCGTGLLGPELAPRVDRLEGFDLSANMLAKARDKQLYHHLAQADLSRAPTDSGVFAAGLAPGRADLVAAADVLMYLGDLKAVMRIAADLSVPGALFVFSVEDGGDSDSFSLRPSLRYAHGRAYVEARLAEVGFAARHLRRSPIRKDGADQVHGMLFVAEKAD